IEICVTLVDTQLTAQPRLVDLSTPGPTAAIGGHVTIGLEGFHSDTRSIGIDVVIAVGRSARDQVVTTIALVDRQIAANVDLMPSREQGVARRVVVVHLPTIPVTADAPVTLRSDVVREVRHRAQIGVVSDGPSGSVREGRRVTREIRM